MERLPRKTRAKRPKTRLTIFDVAREAGVSTKTVSKVMNNQPGVSEETRERVLKVVRELGYHPHYGARALRAVRRNCIGVTVAPPLSMVPLREDFLVWLLAKLSTTFSAGGAYLTFDTSRLNEGSMIDYSRGVWERMYDLCFIVGPFPLDDNTINRIHFSGTPYLALGRPVPCESCNYAAVDLERAAYESAKFLLARGHRHILMLSAFEGYSAGWERREGFCRAMTESGISRHEAEGMVVDAGTRPEHLEAALREALESGAYSAMIDSTALENPQAIRSGCASAGKIPGKDLDVVIWTYEEKGVILPEASAHVWIPVRKAVLRGIEEIARIYLQPVEQRRTGGEIHPPIPATQNPMPILQILEPPVLSTQRQPASGPHRAIRIVDLL